MKPTKALYFSKLLLIITIVSLVSCKKQTDISFDQSISKTENAFFYREKASISVNEMDLVDTIIGFCKKADSTAHFSKKIASQYGYPKWDLAVTIGNSNGLKSLFIPVVDTGSQVQFLIFAYQETPQRVKFKFIDRNTEQTQLPKATGDGSIFSKESLIGIFGALDKSVAASRVPKNSSMEGIKANGSYISSLCWLISWHYEDGSVGVVNSQCSYQVFITPGVSYTSGLPESMIGVYEDIQAGDGGGGMTWDENYLIDRLHESLMTEVKMINKTVIDVDQVKQTTKINFEHVILEGGAPFGSWRYVSTDKVVFKKNQEKNIYEIISIDHLAIEKRGIQIGLESDLVLNSTVPKISPDKRMGWLDLNSTVYYKLTVAGIPFLWNESNNKTIDFSFL